MSQVPDYIRAAFQKKPAKELKPITKAIRPQAPAPRLAALEHEPAKIQNALAAWECRVRGQPIVDVAKGLGMTIEGAKRLIAEAHDAVREDLKENLELNRQLDLDRIDGMLQTFYPLAKAGDIDSASFTLKCLNQRAKLTGLEPQISGDTSGKAPHNVLVWIQNQLPQINQIVDALPVE